jgi:hypothetical protein
MLLSCVVFTATFSFAAPAITGTAVIDAPPILKWEYDLGTQTPNFHDENSNMLWDFHGTLDTCDVMLSSEGNYHMALRDIWPTFLMKFKEPLNNAFYSTTPPLFKNRGIVILVKKGNPKNIHTIWDLGRADVNLITPSTFEPGVFKVYTDSIYNIAHNDSNPPANTNADKLFDQLFNGTTGNSYKWLRSARIHHRDEPWSVAYGKADAAVIYHHLGIFAKQTFPDTFDIVPLGGTVDNPQPLVGTVITDRYVVALKGVWTRRQREAQQTLINTLLSDDFTQILEKRGLQRPDGFVSANFSPRIKISSK